jgi:hypothetical protein
MDHDMRTVLITLKRKHARSRFRAWLDKVLIKAGIGLISASSKVLDVERAPVPTPTIAPEPVRPKTVPDLSDEIETARAAFIRNAADKTWEKICTSDDYMRERVVQTAAGLETTFVYLLSDATRERVGCNEEFYVRAIALTLADAHPGLTCIVTKGDDKHWRIRVHILHPAPVAPVLLDI